jgi:hypothetical protein
MCCHFVVYVATPGRLALAAVLQLVDCNVTHDVTLFCVGSPIYTKYKTLARQKYEFESAGLKFSDPYMIIILGVTAN